MGRVANHGTQSRIAQGALLAALTIAAAGCHKNQDAHKESPAQPATNAQQAAAPAPSTSAPAPPSGSGSAAQGAAPSAPPAAASSASPTAPPPGPPASAAASQPPAEAAPAPATQQANNAPQPASVVVPDGTPLRIRVDQRISVKTSHAGDRFSGTIVSPVVVEGTEVIPAGSMARGEVLEAHRRGHFKGHSVLELTLTSLDVNGRHYHIDTRRFVRTKKGKGKRTAAFIGGGTGVGMLIGGVATGGVGLLVGGLSGAGAGTLGAAFTGNRDINIPAETVMTFRLAEPIQLQ